MKMMPGKIKLVMVLLRLPEAAGSSPAKSSKGEAKRLASPEWGGGPPVAQLVRAPAVAA